ncbi:FecR domain-containing protein [Sphingobium sp. BYY-5]|uniref:FecR family protein n=1 Tax=Sphingobium sp. BYY-5 TaxID=2926400 RepID=UPI001FA6C69B|nr:FecR domain-containing protein [Sphingobium sp. BYY-5]MCI4592688.1 FecR domain-containing protein [Sphingobium sp. BYY-5]
MGKREDSRSIDEAASDWTARLDRGPLTPEEDASFQHWLSLDPRNKGAMLRAQALSLMSESAQALGPSFDPTPFEAPRRRAAILSRRQALGWGGGAIAAVAGMAAISVGMPAAGAIIRTGRGEMRLVPLEDGSTALLNTDTSIRVRYDDAERRISLLRGEVYFSVTRDDRRPFVVEAGTCRLRTAQAGFRVRKLDRDPIDILVHQGQIEVPDTTPFSKRSALVLSANMHMVMADMATGLAAERPEPIAPDRIARDLAWREGKLAFEGETLQQAAAAFARYSDMRIIIKDPALAQEPVAGLFTANDPVGFSRAVSRIFDARVEQHGGELLLTRAVSPAKNFQGR